MTKGRNWFSRLLNGALRKAGANGCAVLNDRGVSLIIVLWVTALLMLIVAEFSFSMRVEGGLVRNFKDELSAREIAMAGINLASAEVSSNYSLVAIDRDGRLVFLKREGGALRPIEAGREMALGEGTLTYEITDERGKINVNTASRETMDEILRVTGVEKTERDTIADSILDWRDPNHEFRLNGAEDDYYSTLPDPYGAKDDLLDTVEELLLVKGMTPEVFYGSGKAPKWLSAGVKGFQEKGYGGVGQHLTTKGDGRINVNTASLTVLEAAFGKGRAHEIMLRREGSGFFEQSLHGGIVSSDVFSVRSVGEVRGIRVGVRAILEKGAGSSSVRAAYWNEEGITAD